MINCAFTIVAKNYIGLALILEKSIRQYYNELDFYIVVADEVDSSMLKELPANVIIAKDSLSIPAAQWEDMSFKYNLTEFCTAIKPAAFQYIFKEYAHEKCIYLDPDIYFYGSIGSIFEMLDHCQILLTPHITQISAQACSDAPESAWLSCGMYNLGFCGLRRSASADRLLVWWNERLINNCFIDSYNSLFTDQKWMDFIPSFFTSEELHITQHLGLNAAPWNFFEREVFKKESMLWVKPRNNGGETYPLLFVHYSGYNYSELKKGNVIQNNIASLKNYLDITILTELYAKAISEQSQLFDRYINQTYSYNSFANGDAIQIVHRRLYRALTDRGEKFSHLFGVQKNSYYELLAKHRMLAKGQINLDKVNKNNLTGVTRKLSVFNKLTRVLYRVIGMQRYVLLIRLLSPFARYEAQIHLLDRRFDEKNIL